MAAVTNFYATYRKAEKGVRFGGFSVLADKQRAKSFLSATIETPITDPAPKIGRIDEGDSKRDDRFEDLTREVFDIFLALYDTIPNIRSASSVIPSFILEDQLKTFIKENALEVENFESGELYTLPIIAHDRVARYLQNHDSALKTNRYIDRFFILGLISLYDQFIRTLAEHVIEIKPHCLTSNDRTIKISELLTFKTIEEVKGACMDRELDKLLRESHLEQFRWFEDKLDMKIDPAGELKARFIELCERRNLFAHTGGKVSQQYIDECSKAGCELKGVKLGDELKSSKRYFVTAVETIIEVATQLVHVIWQKTDEKGSSGAARSLINITFNLIRDRKYELAIKLIEFILDNRSTHSKLDLETKRIHLINHANAQKLSGKPEFLARIDKEDWSSMTLKEEICLLAVRGDDEKVLALLPKAFAAEQIDAQCFRTWPVFEPLRQSEKSVTAIQRIFKEPVVEDVSRRTN